VNAILYFKSMEGVEMIVMPLNYDWHRKNSTKRL
jgi:hypothetical protein